LTFPVGLAETHSAVVVFFGDRAYKVKKPIDLGFLDFRDRATRAAVCHREVELNRRLSPDVYLGVADVHGPDGEVCDHLVVMRRMPAGRRLSSLVRASVTGPVAGPTDGDPAGDDHDVDVDDQIWRLAHLIAGFHARAERGPAIDAAATADALAGRWRMNSAGLERLAGRIVDGDRVAAVLRLAEHYLAGRAPLFDRRIGERRAVDGHGDLLTDDVFCLDDGPRVLDCLEFDDALRYGDTLADVAFLAMDLERLGRPDLAMRFLTAYAEHADDTWPASLEHHHVGYRFQVRALVNAIRAEQGEPGAAEESARLLASAHAHLEAGRVRLVLVGGLPGTGKSTVAAGLGEALGATVLRSDELRKELAGVPAHQPAPAKVGRGLYAPEVTARTYGELVRRAEIALGLGEVVVLDASWTDETWRLLARSAAERAHADLAELRCDAQPAVAAARLRARLTTGGDPSDATPEVAAALAQAAAPWPTATTIDTTGDPETTLAAALDQLRRA
jgi:uncharacterized protein